MSTDESSPRRKAPIHQPVHYWQGVGVVILVTVNTSLKKSILARHDVHRLLRDTWASADDWMVGRYVIMPDHLHFLCSPRSTSASLIRWMRYWKSLASRRWPRPEEQQVWQRDFWDTQLRKGDSYAEKWAYIRANPVRSGLVTDASQWPFAGKIHSLEL